INGVEGPLRCRVAPTTLPNASGMLSVRPEAVSVRPAGTGGISGRVSSTMYLGNLSQLQIRLDFGKTIEVLELNRRPWTVGDAVTVTFDPEQCFFISGSRQVQQTTP